LISKQITISTKFIKILKNQARIKRSTAHRELKTLETKPYRAEKDHTILGSDDQSRAREKEEVDIFGENIGLFERRKRVRFQRQEKKWKRKRKEKGEDREREAVMRGNINGRVAQKQRLTGAQEF